MGLFKKAPLARRYPELAGFPSLDDGELDAELARRMDMPQRHRLLQGYPMPRAMRPMDDDDRWDRLRVPSLGYRDNQLVGVLPHPFCVPEVKGCGFCTFPHERHRKNLMLPLATAIAREMGTHKLDRRPGRTAIYLGGGTANLVTDEALRVITAALVARFGTGAEELTLEGVPRFFSESQLEILSVLGAGRVRFSMGLQTFDEAWLSKMGRMGIGAPEHVESALALARAHSVQTSCDLLINLPGQDVEDMLRDVDTAASLGFHQVCVYHLVLFEGLGTEWSKDPQMLAGRPDNAQAFENWRAVRARLEELGFEQSTLTNFERAEIPLAERFTYELLSFRAATTRMIGLGPGGISGTGHSGDNSLKWINPTEADAYLAASEAGGGSVRPQLAYAYDWHEDVLTVLTRGLAGLGVSRAELARFGDRALELFEPELAALARAGLLEDDATRFAPTTRGMFFADSIAGLLAHRAVQHRRARGHNDIDNDAFPLHMG
jgi:oxygen-independent coproporphyrinogen-3 oxidase